MAKGEVIVKIVGDASKFVGALGTADQELGGFAGRLDQTGSKFIGFGAKMTAGVTLPIIGLAAAATKAAADESQEMAVLERTMKNAVGATDQQVAATEEWITATQNATGVSDGELRPALGKLLIAGRDVEQAQKDMAVALDISAARGVSLETVVSAMAKAAQGNTGAMGRLGIATKDAAGETLTYDQILQQASATMGGSAAAAADTAAGRMAITRAKMADAAETIGASLLPALERLSSLLSAGADAFSNLTQDEQTAIIAAAGLVAAIGPVSTVAGGAMKAVSSLAQATQFLATTQNAAAIGATGLGAALIGAGVMYASYRALTAAAEQAQSDWNDSAAETVNTAALVGSGVMSSSQAMQEQAVNAYIAAGAIDQGSDAMESAAANAAILGPQITKATGTLTAMSEESGVTQERIVQLANELGINLGAMSDEAREKLAGAVAQISAGVTPTERLDNVTETLGNEFATTTEQVDAFQEALDALLGSQLNAEEAQIRVRQKTDELRKAIEEGTRADESAEQAKDRLASQTIDLVGSIEDEVAALVRNGEVAADSESQHAALLMRLVALQNEFPELRGQIQVYIDKLNAVPTEKETRITADVSQALAEIDRLIVKINGIPFAIVGGSALARQIKIADKPGGGSGGFAGAAADELLGLGRDADVTFDSIVASLKQEAADARSFAAVFDDLKKQGLSQSVLSRLADAGPDALRLAQELAYTASDETSRVGQINALLADLEAAKRLTASTPAGGGVGLAKSAGGGVTYNFDFRGAYVFDEAGIKRAVADGMAAKV